MAGLETLKINAELVEAAKQPGFFKSAAKKDPKSGLIKEYQGASFYNNEYHFGGKTYGGWFTTTEDIQIRGVADPTNKEDKRNAFDSTRNKLEMKMSEAGVLGQFLDQLNKVYRAEAERMIAAEEFAPADAYPIRDIVGYNFSKKNTNKEIAGKPREDPVIYLKFSPGNFPATFPAKFLQNQPKFVVFDTTKQIKRPNGRIAFAQATVEKDGKTVPVSLANANIHEFIGNGSILKAGSRLFIPSISLSSTGISMAVNIIHANIEPRQEYEGFDDEVDEVTTGTTALNINPASLPYDPEVAVTSATEGVPIDSLSAAADAVATAVAASIADDDYDM